MILNNVGDHAGIPDLFLSMENTLLILFRTQVRFGCIPAIRALSITGFLKNQTWMKNIRFLQ